jgi:hypothetical protein
MQLLKEISDRLAHHTQSVMLKVCGSAVRVI